MSEFHFSDDVYSLGEGRILDGVYGFDERCILIEVGGVCGLGGHCSVV